MFKWTLLTISLLMLITRAHAQIPSEATTVRLAAHTVMTPQNIGSLHYEVMPSDVTNTAKAAAPADALATVTMADASLSVYQRDNRLTIEHQPVGAPSHIHLIKQLSDTERVVAQFSPDGEYLVFVVYMSSGGEVGYEPYIYMWNVAEHRLIRRAHNHQGDWIQFYFVPRTHHLLTTDRGGESLFGLVKVFGNVKTWDLDTGVLLGSFHFDSDSTYGDIITFNPADASTFIRSTAQTIEVIELATGNVLKTYTTDDQDYIEEVIVSSDGIHLAAVTGQTLYMLDMTRHSQPVSLYREADAPYGENHNIRFSPDGQLLFMTGSDQLYVYETATGNMLKSVPVERGFSLWMQMDTEGRYLVTWNQPGANERGWVKYRWSVDTQLK